MPKDLARRGALDTPDDLGLRLTFREAVCRVGDRRLGPRHPDHDDPVEDGVRLPIGPGAVTPRVLRGISAGLRARPAVSRAPVSPPISSTELSPADPNRVVARQHDDGVT
jgi:hypothetical protein